MNIDGKRTGKIASIVTGVLVVLGGGSYGILDNDESVRAEAQVARARLDSRVTVCENSNEILREELKELNRKIDALAPQVSEIVGYLRAMAEKGK